MTIEGGESRQKIDKERIIIDAQKELKEIQEGNESQSIKTKKYKRLARKIVNQLHEDKRRKLEGKIKLSTFKRYLSEVRNRLKDTGYTHHSLPLQVAKLSKRYPEYSDLIESLLEADAHHIRAERNNVMKAIKANKKGKNRIQAYADVKEMVIDHEVIRNIEMPSVHKADLSDAASESLQEKKTNTVSLKHHEIINLIHEGLKSSYYSYQAFALALASGRRAIEVIYYGEVKKTGDNTVMFTGQAKKHTGADNPAYEIYTLIPASDFIKAFDRFRKHSSVKDIHTEIESQGWDADTPENRDNRSLYINRRTARTFNDAAKRLLSDKARMFKDTRAIYTRVCLETFFKTDSKWSTTDETEFAQQLLGHEDEQHQAHYKQFKLIFVDHEEIKQEQEEQQEQQEQRIKANSKHLNKAGKQIDQYVKQHPANDGLTTFHEKVVKWANEYPDQKLNTSAFVKGRAGTDWKVGGNRNTIKLYLSIVQSSIDQYNQQLD